MRRLPSPPSGKFFCRFPSKLPNQGARRLGIVLGTLPKVNGAGCAKAAVLNHASKVGLEMCGSPTRFGRWLPPNELVLLVAALMASGNPDFKVSTPDTCQLPTMPLTILFAGASGLPLPTGNS